MNRVTKTARSAVYLTGHISVLNDSMQELADSLSMVVSHLPCPNFVLGMDLTDLMLTACYRRFHKEGIIMAKKETLNCLKVTAVDRKYRPVFLRTFWAWLIIVILIAVGATPE